MEWWHHSVAKCSLTVHTWTHRSSSSSCSPSPLKELGLWLILYHSVLFVTEVNHRYLYMMKTIYLINLRVFMDGVRVTLALKCVPFYHFNPIIVMWLLCGDFFCQSSGVSQLILFYSVRNDHQHLCCVLLLHRCPRLKFPEHYLLKKQHGITLSQVLGASSEVPYPTAGYHVWWHLHSQLVHPRLSRLVLPSSLSGLVQRRAGLTVWEAWGCLPTGSERFSSFTFFGSAWIALN